MTYGNYPDLKNVKRVLVIKMRHLGDVLLTGPVFSNLKREMPHATIDAYIYKDSLPMLEGHPAISSFLLYDRGWKTLSFFQKLKHELAMLLKVRRGHYDLVINLTEGDRGAIAAFFSKSPCRVGFDPGKKGLFGKNKIYTHVVKHCPTPRHTVERLLDATRCLGIFPGEGERELTFVIEEEVKKGIQSRLNSLGIERGEYLVFHPVSRWLFKSPPPSLFARVIEELVKSGQKVVLTSGPCDKEKIINTKILTLLPRCDGVIDLSGETTLKELGALIQMAKALVTVDSVPLHMASALKTPVVALFGPSSEKNWGPWQHSRARVVTSGISCRPCGRDGCGGSKYSDCLFTLTAEQVLANIHSLLRRSATA